MYQKRKFRLATVGVIFPGLDFCKPVSRSYCSGNLWRMGDGLRLTSKLVPRVSVCLESGSVVVTSKNKQLLFLSCTFHPGHQDFSNLWSINHLCKHSKSLSKTCWIRTSGVKPRNLWFFYSSLEWFLCVLTMVFYRFLKLTSRVLINKTWQYIKVKLH